MIAVLLLGLIVVLTGCGIIYDRFIERHNHPVLDPDTPPVPPHHHDNANAHGALLTLGITSVMLLSVGVVWLLYR